MVSTTQSESCNPAKYGLTIRIWKLLRQTIYIYTYILWKLIRMRHVRYCWFLLYDSLSTGPAIWRQIYPFTAHHQTQMRDIGVRNHLFMWHLITVLKHQFSDEAGNAANRNGVFFKAHHFVLTCYKVVLPENLEYLFFGSCLVKTGPRLVALPKKTCKIQGLFRFF